MLKRKIFDALVKWKNSNSNKSVIIEGARQIGKTFIIRAFGKEKYESFIEINFLERDDLKMLFDGSLSTDNILNGIKLSFPEIKIIPEKTLIFFDEVQECPRAITALKFLSQDSRVDVISTGSALGMAYNRTESYPVGYVEHFDMYALDFEEFLWAIGIDAELIDSIREFYEKRIKVPTLIHEKMLEHLRNYMIIGGMPEVLNTFIPENDYSGADAVQKRIYRDYLVDIARYALPDNEIKAEKCYRSIPSQLIKENHKFQYKLVENKGTSRKFESSIDWLISAHIAIQVNNVTKPEYPLESYKIDNNERIYMNDIGLYIGTYDYHLKKALLNDRNISDIPENNIILRSAKGGIYEALAADILYKKKYDPLYFFRNQTGNVEMEFLIENKDGVIPIEIKAGRTKARSLNTILQNEDIKYGYKFSSQNVGENGKVITLPIYMMMFI